MFNKKLFSFLYSYNRQLPTSVDTILTLLGQKSGDRRLSKCLDLFKIEKVFTWNTIKGVKAVSFKMSNEFDDSDILYLDIQEDGRMFLSDGPLTSRTSFPYYMISRFEHSQRIMMKRVLEQLNSEEADIQSLLNSTDFCEIIPDIKATGTELITGDFWYYLQFKEIEGKIYKFFGRPHPEYHKGYGCFESEAERSLKDHPNDFVVLVGSKWSSEKRKRSFNVLYPERMFDSDYYLRKAIEQTYWMNEDGSFEKTYGKYDFMRDKLETIIRENSSREGAFLYYGKTGEVKDHWDISLIPEKVTLKRSDGRYTTLTQSDLPQLTD